LSNIRERADEIGAGVTMTGNSQSGTRITATVHVRSRR
jgi:signal transduction histidine kinase